MYNALHESARPRCGRLTDIVNEEEARVDLDMQLFVEALGQISGHPPRRRNRHLRDLAFRYKDKLGNCSQQVPFNLKRLDYPVALSFSDFIYEVISRTA